MALKSFKDIHCCLSPAQQTWVEREAKTQRITRQEVLRRLVDVARLSKTTISYRPTLALRRGGGDLLPEPAEQR
jgi:hypothetical protein